MKNTILFLSFIFLVGSCKDDLPAFRPDPIPSTAKVELNAGPDTSINLPMRVNFEPKVYILNSHNVPFQTSWRQLSGPKIDLNPGAFRLFEPGNYSFEITAVSGQRIWDTDTLNINAALNNPCSAPQPVKLSKTLVTTFYFYGDLSSMSIAGDRIIFGAGYDSFSSFDLTFYDPSADMTLLAFDVSNYKWNSSFLTEPKGELSTAALGNKVFFAGGRTTIPTNTVEIYDAKNDRREPIMNLSSARSKLAMASAGSKIFFAGGIDKTGKEQSTIDIYDTITKSWSLAMLKEPRKDISAITINNKVFFVGGSYRSTPLNTVDVYDISNGTMSNFSMNTARSKPIVNSFGNKLFIAGGILDESKFEYQTETYDINTGEYTVSCLSEYAYGSGTICSAWHQNRLYILNRQSPRGTIDIYDPASNTWNIFTSDVSKNIRNIALFSGGNTLYLVQAPSTSDSYEYSLYKLN